MSCSRTQCSDAGEEFSLMMIQLFLLFQGKTEVFQIAEDIDDARSSDHILLPYDLPPTAYKKGGKI